MKSTDIKVMRYMEENRMLEGAGHIVAGISGGADSMYLLYVLIRTAGAENITAVHVNHGLRGEAAVEDEQYVKKWCDRHSVNCTVYRKDIKKYAEEEHLTEEEAGRIYRYEVFRSEVRRHSHAVIAVAHHMDDQAETVLFNMLRGSAVTGIGGMRPVSADGMIIRPLLCIRKKDITERLTELGIQWRTDLTNNDNGYSRNLIRNKVIPFLTENIQSSCVEHIASVSDSARDAADLINGLAKKEFKKNVSYEDGGISFDAEKAAVLHPALKKEFIFLCLKRVSGRSKDITESNINSVEDIMKGGTGKKAMLPYGMMAENTYGMIHIYAAPVGAYEDHLQNRKKNVLYSFRAENISDSRENKVSIMTPDGIRADISMRMIHTYPGSDMFKKNCTAFIDCDTITGVLAFRTPAESDAVTLSGGERKKLSRIFIDEKIPRAERENIVILAEEDHVVWIPEIARLSREHYVDEDSHDILEISFMKRKL